MGCLRPIRRLLTRSSRRVRGGRIWHSSISPLPSASDAGKRARHDRRHGGKMTKTMVLLAALAVAVAIGVGSAGAITDGLPDGNGHPYVGLMVAQDSSGTPLWRCSGTLL